jgi:hypothetical protein
MMLLLIKLFLKLTIGRSVHDVIIDKIIFEVIGDIRETSI